MDPTTDQSLRTRIVSKLLLISGAVVHSTNFHVDDIYHWNQAKRLHNSYMMGGMETEGEPINISVSAGEDLFCLRDSGQQGTSKALKLAVPKGRETSFRTRAEPTLEKMFSAFCERVRTLTEAWGSIATHILCSAFWS